MPTFNEITEVTKGSHGEDWANEITREEVHFIIEHYFLNLGLDEVRVIPEFINVLLRRLKKGFLLSEMEEVIISDQGEYDFQALKLYQLLATENSMIYSFSDYLIHKKQLLNAFLQTAVQPGPNFHFVPSIWDRLCKEAEVEHYKNIEQQIAWEEDQRVLADAELEYPFDSEPAYGYEKWYSDKATGEF